MKTLPTARTPDLLSLFTQVPTKPAAPGKTASPFPDKPDDWLHLDVSDEAKRAFHEDAGVADELARGAKASKRAADQYDIQAAKERLRLLKLLAQQAIASGDAKLARSIAKEIGEIAHRVGNMAGPGGSDTAPAAAGAEAPQGAGEAPAGPAEAAEDATAALNSPEVPATEEATAEEKTAAEKSAAMPSLGDDGLSMKEEVRELLKLAKKILDKLREAFGHDTEIAKEINKAGREMNEAAEKWGVNLEGGDTEVSGASFSLTVTQTVEVVQFEAAVSINIKV